MSESDIFANRRIVFFGRGGRKHASFILFNIHTIVEEFNSFYVRIHERSLIRDKSKKPLVASDDAKSRKGERLHKHNIYHTDGVKYMSYLKVWAVFDIPNLYMKFSTLSVTFMGGWFVLIASLGIVISDSVLCTCFKHLII